MHEMCLQIRETLEIYYYKQLKGEKKKEYYYNYETEIKNRINIIIKRYMNG